MSVPEKEQAHPAGSKGKEAYAEAADDVDPDALPPSYTESGQSKPLHGRPSSSHESSEPEAGSIPTNQVSISRVNEQIVGHWVIDTNLKVPVSHLQALTAGPNLSLETRNRSIEVSVSLIAGTAHRAVIILDAINGKIEFGMAERLNRQPFSVKARAINGPIRVILPRDFIGPLKYRAVNGRVNFSRPLQKFAPIFQPGFFSKVSFIGSRWTGLFQSFDRWEGDVVEVDAINGDVQFDLAD